MKLGIMKTTCMEVFAVHDLDLGFLLIRFAVLCYSYADLAGFVVTDVLMQIC